MRRPTTEDIALRETIALDAPAPDKTRLEHEKSPVRIRLEILDGPNRGQKFQYEDHTTLVAGRSEKAQLRFEHDLSCSRHHFLLEVNPPRLYLRDLGSRNGTLVNNQRVDEAFLRHGDVICGGATHLRVSFVNEDGSPFSKGIFDEFDLQATPFEPSGSQDPASAALPDGYAVRDLIGRGNMGVVYLADEVATGRAVALKVIVPAFASDERAVKLFLREASVLRQLNHSRIVRFFDVGISRGSFYLAMEYVDTISLKTTLSEQSEDARIRAYCGIMCQVLDALSHAHRLGLVHRDIKPENILVCRFGKKLRTKLADFGLSKSFEDAGLSNMTRIGEMRGTPAYMAPEQLINCRDVKPAADIYGAAAALYNMLTDRMPHDYSGGKNVLQVVLEDQPVPIRERNPHVPDALAEVIHKGLAREAADRYASASLMRRALLPFAMKPTDSPE